MQGFTKPLFARGSPRDSLAVVSAYETNLISSARAGTTLTASGSTHTKGSFADLIAATAHDVYGVWVRVAGPTLSGSPRSALLDIGYDSGSGDTVIIPNLDIGAAGISNLVSSNQPAPKIYYCPGIYIPSGSAISGRIQCDTGSATCIVQCWAETNVRWNKASTTGYTAYGPDTATSAGVATPCANGAYGAWTNIATTSADHELWTVGYDLLADGSEAAGDFLIEIGYGPNSGSVTTMATGLFGQSTVVESIFTLVPPYIFYPLSSGNKLWARIASTHTENRGISIYGV